MSSFHFFFWTAFCASGILTGKVDMLMVLLMFFTNQDRSHSVKVLEYVWGNNGPCILVSEGERQKKKIISVKN